MLKSLRLSYYELFVLYYTLGLMYLYGPAYHVSPKDLNEDERKIIEKFKHYLGEKDRYITREFPRDDWYDYTENPRARSNFLELRCPAEACPLVERVLVATIKESENGDGTVFAVTGAYLKDIVALYENLKTQFAEKR